MPAEESCTPQEFSFFQLVGHWWSKVQEKAAAATKPTQADAQQGLTLIEMCFQILICTPDHPTHPKKEKQGQFFFFPETCSFPSWLVLFMAEGIPTKQPMKNSPKNATSYPKTTQQGVNTPQAWGQR